MSEQIARTAERIRQNVQKVIVGKDDVLTQIVIALLAQGHVLLEDVPGVGKTTLAKAVARSLGCSYRRIQFTPDLLPSDVIGVSHFDPQAQAFAFRPGPLIAQVVLADEINRATPRTQSALLEAMQEQQITVDDRTIPLPAPFIVLATQNPVELEGTFPLPEAQIDRFLLRTRLGYPSQEEEHHILLRFERSDSPRRIEAVTAPEELLAMQALVRQVRVEASVRDYVARLVQATRTHPAVELGVSPRGAMALQRTCQARAAVEGREFVLPDDAKAMAPSVLTHRIVVNPQSRLRGALAEEVVMDVLTQVAVPVERLS